MCKEKGVKRQKQFQGFLNFSTQNDSKVYSGWRRSFCARGHLDFCGPSPSAHSWVKIKKSINTFLGSMTQKRGIFTDNI